MRAISDEQEQGKFVRIEEAVQEPSRGDAAPPLVLVFDPPSETVVSSIAEKLEQLRVGGGYVVKVVTPDDNNLTVEGLLQRIRGYIGLMYEGDGKKGEEGLHHFTSVSNIPSLPIPTQRVHEGASNYDTPVVFFSRFSPQDVSSMIQELRMLLGNVAFAVEVGPGLSKSVVYLVEEIRGDHADANSPQPIPSSAGGAVANNDIDDRDYDIAAIAILGVFAFVTLYGYETYRLWQEGGLFLPPPFDALLKR